MDGEMEVEGVVVAAPNQSEVAVDLDPRAKTLAALSTFLTHQRALVARTQQDMEKLRLLKKTCTITSSPNPAAAVLDKLGTSGIASLSALAEDVDALVPTQVLAEIEWSVFGGRDPAPLRALTQSLRTASPYALRNKPTPNLIPNAPSALQTLVRDARRAILDPVLALYGEEEPCAPLSPMALKTPRAGDPCAGEGAGEARMPLRGPSGLFIRRPKVQERAGTSAGTSTRAGSSTLVDGPDVDGGVDEEDGTMSVAGTVSVSGCWATPPPFSAATTTATAPPPWSPATPRGEPLVYAGDAEPALPMALAKPVRARRISTKLARQNEERAQRGEGVGQGARMTRRRSSAATASSSILLRVKREEEEEGVGREEEAEEEEREEAAKEEAGVVLGKRKRERTEKPPPKARAKSKSKSKSKIKAEEQDPELEEPPNPSQETPHPTGKEKEKPATYKQPWSASEQNLLERLLAEVPAADPRRYAKISAAMGGRRTARQVASRVQKWVEKLKRYGVKE